MNLPLWLASPGFVILFRWTCLLAFGWLVHWALRRRHPRWRMILWRGILCSGLVLPLLHFFPFPGVKIPVRISHPPALGDRVAAAQIRPALSAAAPSPHLPPAADPVSRTAKTSPNPALAAPFRRGDILAAIWILGCVFGALRLLRLQLRLSHLRKTCRPIPDLQRLATQIQNRLNVRGEIDVTISEDVSSPFVCGLFKPAIILPQTLAQNLSTAEVYSLLSHEIAHLRQHDLFWCVAWQWMKAASWFHPLAWNIPVAHNLACEQEADRVAAGQLENADSYSQMLARLALRVLALPAVETKLTLNGSSQIARRLNYLRQNGTGAWNWKLSAAGFGIVALIFLMTAGSGFSILPASAPQGDVRKHLLDRPETAISVPGMQQYTDASFGFSFWYPATWTVKEETYDDAHSPYEGGSVIKSLVVTPPETRTLDPIHLREFVSSEQDVIDSSNAGPVDDPPLYSAKYYFDNKQHLWMTQTKGTRTAKWSAPEAADISNNTMGGLHLFSGTARFDADTIIPLSAKKFVIADNANAGDGQTPLASTIIALDPAVATPVGNDEQIDVIRAEGVLYGVIGKRSGVFYTDERNVYDSHGHMIPGAKASRFKLISGYYAADVYYSTDGLRVYEDAGKFYPKLNEILEGADPKTFKPLRQDFAKDRSHVWYMGKLIGGADPKTFVLNEEKLGVRRPDGTVTIAHDSRYTYGLDGKDNIVITVEN